MASCVRCGGGRRAERAKAAGSTTSVPPVAAAAPATTPHVPVRVALADMGQLQQVATLGQQLLTDYPRIDVVVHNAGALLDDRYGCRSLSLRVVVVPRSSALSAICRCPCRCRFDILIVTRVLGWIRRRVTTEGNEVTVATHVLGPQLLTTMLLPSLRPAHGRVITVSSGGMYGLPLPADGMLEMAKYDGVNQVRGDGSDTVKRGPVKSSRLCDTVPRAARCQSGDHCAPFSIEGPYTGVIWPRARAFVSSPFAIHGWTNLCLFGRLHLSSTRSRSEPRLR